MRLKNKNKNNCINGAFLPQATSPFLLELFFSFSKKKKKHFGHQNQCRTLLKVKSYQLLLPVLLKQSLA